MTRYQQLDAEQFAAAEGVVDWQVRGVWAHAVFATGSFARGVELVTAIGGLADEADHHPDVLLTYPRVAVRLSTHETDSLTDADVALAAAISRAAADLGVAVDPEATGAGLRDW